MRPNYTRPDDIDYTYHKTTLLLSSFTYYKSSLLQGNLEATDEAGRESILKPH